MEQGAGFSFHVPCSFSGRPLAPCWPPEALGKPIPQHLISYLAEEALHHVKSAPVVYLGHVEDDHMGSRSRVRSASASS